MLPGYSIERDSAKTIDFIRDFSRRPSLFWETMAHPVPCKTSCYHSMVPCNCIVHGDSRRRYVSSTCAPEVQVPCPLSNSVDWERKQGILKHHAGATAHNSVANGCAMHPSHRTQTLSNDTTMPDLVS